MRKKLLKNTFEISNVLKNIAHEDRLGILAFIDKDRKSVTEIVEQFDLPQSTVSNHLRFLKENEILESKRTGRVVEYQVTDKRLLNLLKQLKKIYL